MSNRFASIFGSAAATVARIRKDLGRVTRRGLIRGVFIGGKFNGLETAVDFITKQIAGVTDNPIRENPETECRVIKLSMPSVAVRSRSY